MLHSVVNLERILVISVILSQIAQIFSYHLWLSQISQNIAYAYLCFEVMAVIKLIYKLHAIFLYKGAWGAQPGNRWVIPQLIAVQLSREIMSCHPSHSDKGSALLFFWLQLFGNQLGRRRKLKC